MRLTKKTIRQIKMSTVIVAKLVQASGKSYPTIMRWLDENDVMLTTAACLQVICEELKVTQDEVLEKVA